MLTFAAALTDATNKLMNQGREYWYMGSMAACKTGQYSDVNNT
jgi:hypothetical protein